MWVIYFGYCISAILIIFSFIKTLKNRGEKKRYLVPIVLIVIGLLALYFAIGFHLMQIEDFHVDE